MLQLYIRIQYQNIYNIAEQMSIVPNRPKGGTRQTHAAPGKRIILDNPSDFWIKNNSAKHTVRLPIILPNSTVREPRAVVLHYMKSVLQSMRNLLMQQCNIKV